ncbi:hypothetical protein [Actinoplanes sp. NPDC049316]|uniref:hypothetical protein n=1 Tax=Actinoplanes sp. NPDC049316 TaxID=3154727 RepID=UPI00342C747D
MTTLDPGSDGRLSGVRFPQVPRGLVLWQDTVVGAAFAAEEATAGLIGRLRRAAGRRPQIVDRFAGRGAAERERWRRRAAETTEAAVTMLARSPLLDRIVDDQLQRVMRPVVHAVLDDVLLLLEREPERIRTLVRGQRETMVDELVGRLRAGAVAGDAAVDRMTSRVLHRSPAQQPPPASGP